MSKEAHTTTIDEETLRMLGEAVELLKKVSENRIKGRAWGTLKMSFDWQAGVLKEYRIEETSIRKARA